MEKHLAFGARFYDPMVDKTLVENQYHDFDKFLKGLKLIVIMVGHSHLKENISKINDLVVYDTRHCVETEHLYRL